MRSWLRPSRRPAPTVVCALRRPLDTGDYPTGIAVSQERLHALPLERHATHGAWNYSLHPQDVSGSSRSAPIGEAGGPAPRSQATLGQLAPERLNGLSTPQLGQP